MKISYTIHREVERGIVMNRFRELRKGKHLTQAELIDQYNTRYNRTYSIPALSLFENGHRLPELAALQDFADFFGVTVDYLLGKDNPQTFDPPATFFKDPKVGKAVEKARNNPKYQTLLCVTSDLKEDELDSLLTLAEHYAKKHDMN